MGSVKELNIAISCFFFLATTLFSIAHFGTGEPIRGSAYVALALVTALMAIREFQLWKKDRDSKRF